MKILQMLEPVVSLTGNRAVTALKAGEILTAKVDGFDGGKVRLDIGGGRLIFAERQLNVKIGEVVRVRVETPPGVVQLKARPLLDNSVNRSVAESLKTLISGGRSAVGLGPQLQELVSELGRLADRLDAAGIAQKRLPPDLAGQIQSIAKAIQVFDGRLRAEGFAAGLDGVAVRELVENSGLFLEARLASGKDVSHDLKALMLTLRGTLESLQGSGKAAQVSLSAGSTEDIKALVGSLKLAVKAEIGDIESKQAMNLLSQDSGANSTAVSVPLTGEFSRSKLIISEENLDKKNKKNAPKRYRVTLALDMSHLGHIRADVVKLGKSLAISFSVKDAKTYRLLDSHLQQFRARVQAENLQVGEIFLRKSEPGPEKPSPENSSLLISLEA